MILGTTVFHHQLSPYYRDILEYGSIPVVSTVFTYCHIWLALWVCLAIINAHVWWTLCTQLLLCEC